MPQRNLLSTELAKAPLLGGPSLTWQSREGSCLPRFTFACSFSDHLLTIRLKPNLKHVCFFQSHFLWPKKNLTVPDSPNFIFPLWEPHSRIIFLSQTNELQRVHYVAASKQEAGVSDGKAWFYIMRDAWGCTHRPARCRVCSFQPWMEALFSLASHTLRPGWSGSFPRRSSGLPVWNSIYLLTSLAVWELTQPWSPFPNTLPTHPLSGVPPGRVCLRVPRRWAWPQKEISVTFCEHHQRKERARPRVQMWVIRGRSGMTALAMFPSPPSSPLLDVARTTLGSSGSSDHKEPPNRPHGGRHLKNRSFLPAA